MQGYCDIFKWTILKWTSPEVKCLHLTSSRREMCTLSTLSVSNVIYHKFSHGAAFYTLNGKNVNVMLEFCILFARKNKLPWRQSGVILADIRWKPKIGCLKTDDHLYSFSSTIFWLRGTVKVACKSRGPLNRGARISRFDCIR